jgi:opine dehydrogenase
MTERIAVLGAGNGGYACAADFSLAGYAVNLYELPQFVENLRPIIERGGIEISGAARVGFAKLNKVTPEIKEAIEDVDLILIVVPAFGRKIFAETCLRNMTSDQTVIFLGKGGAALEFAKVKEQLRISKDTIVGEANTLPYGCRITGPGKVKVYSTVREFQVAAIPAKSTNVIANALKEIYPSVIPVVNVLETMLNDINAVVHPALVILNAGHIEHYKGDFLIFRKGLGPSVFRLMRSVDNERLALMKALGLKTIPYEELYSRTGFGPPGSLEETITLSYGADMVKVPTLQSRYIMEDVPYGLVPMASLGRLIGIPTPVIDSIITIASTFNQTDYMRDGLTVEKLGLKGLNVDKILEYVTSGKLG